MRTAVTRYYHYVGFNRCADFLNFRQQSLVVGSAEAQLLGSKAYVGIGYARQLFDFVFHLGSAVSTAKVLQNIYTFYLVGIRHTAGAISQAFAAYIAVLLMRMADFAITVSRMTGNVMSVCMSVLMTVVVSAAACVTVCVSVSVFFVLMVVSATALVAVRVSMSVLVLMVVSATACFAVRVCVSVFFIFMLMIIATAAVIAMFMGMLFMVMIVVVSATTSIAMSMLRHMSHSFVIMVLAAVTAGAAFRMLAVILYTIDMAVNMTKSSYIAGTVTDIF